MIRELEDQLEDQGIDNVAAVVCSVGGGGLIGGILRGMDESKSFRGALPVLTRVDLLSYLIRRLLLFARFSFSASGGL